jgi:hypothetical protein
MMHEYSVKGHSREVYVFWLAFVALLTVPLIRWFGAFAGLTISITASGLFWLVFKFWDRVLWRYKGLNKFYGVPNLSGQWECRGKSKRDDGASFDWSGTASIQQNWSRLSVTIQTANSNSQSTLAAIESNNGLGYRLIFGYENLPTSDSGDLISHHGFCDLVFDEELHSAIGTYFNDVQRRTWGTINLTRKKD